MFKKLSNNTCFCKFEEDTNFSIYIHELGELFTKRKISKIKSKIPYRQSRRGYKKRIMNVNPSTQYVAGSSGDNVW